MESNMLLTIHSKVVTRIPRFSVLREDEERWTLRIRDVTREDKGAYACQVNTEPQLRKHGYLDVVGGCIVLIQAYNLFVRKMIFKKGRQIKNDKTMIKKDSYIGSKN